MDKVLMLGSSPSDQSALDLDGEIELLKEKLSACAKGLADLHGDSTCRLTPVNLTKLLSDSNADILHLVGHGAAKGFFIGGQAGNKSVLVSADTFTNVLGRGQPLTLVVLTACYSAEWAEKFLKVSYAVVAMPAETYELSARAFTHSLYENLYAGLSLEDAIANATLVMRGMGDDTSSPVALVRAGQTTADVFLYRAPEIRARFAKEPPTCTKSKGIRLYDIVIYLNNIPDDLAWLRVGADLPDAEARWEFEFVDEDGGDYELNDFYFGNARVIALLKSGNRFTVLDDFLVPMLERHYAAESSEVRLEAEAAIGWIRRDGKPPRLPTNARQTMLPRKKAAAKKPAAKKK